MDKAAETIMGMMANGVNMAALAQLAMMFATFCLCLALYKGANAIVASYQIKANSRLKEGETWLRMQRLGGQTYLAKFLKRGWFKVYLVNGDNEDLIEMTTEMFRDEPKVFPKVIPLGWDKKVHPSEAEE